MEVGFGRIGCTRYSLLVHDPPTTKCMVYVKQAKHAQHTMVLLWCCIHCTENVWCMLNEVYGCTGQTGGVVNRPCRKVGA